MQERSCSNTSYGPSIANARIALIPLERPMFLILQTLNGAPMTAEPNPWN